jgi:hypothetical protein
MLPVILRGPFPNVILRERSERRISPNRRRHGETMVWILRFAQYDMWRMTRDDIGGPSPAATQLKAEDNESYN